jgi:hypothetical protein
MKRTRLFSPETLTKLVMRTISLLLAGFLIMLTDSVMNDLDSWISPPRRSEQAVSAESKAIADQITQLHRDIERKSEATQTLESTLEAARRDYATQKDSFENWLKARKTVGSPTQDPEVLKRVQALDDKAAARDSWQRKIDEAEAETHGVRAQIDRLETQQADQSAAAERKYDAVLRHYELKMFGLRVVIALPLLLLGVLGFLKWRHARYAPLVWGYILFSVYVFFVGVVPYLPDYGGYVRYTVGALLTIVGGIYAIRHVRAYAERKRLELQQSSTERAQRIGQDTAILSFRNHACPSCESDYLLPRVGAEETPAFCFHCGLQLFGPCPHCGTVNFVHFPFCKKCGTALKTSDAAPASL